MYSEGAINSIVADFISGLRCGSPYVFDTGSKLNSSGTENDTIKMNVISNFIVIHIVRFLVNNNVNLE